MKDEEIELLAEDAFDAALAVIRDRLPPRGDMGGHLFTLKRVLMDFIREEARGPS